MKAAIYARSAMLDQSSIDHQIENCTQFACSNDYELAPESTFVDNGQSGASMTERPALQAFIAATKMVPRPFDVVICDETARLGRSMTIVSKILEELHGSGVFICFVSQHQPEQEWITRFVPSLQIISDIQFDKVQVKRVGRSPACSKSN